MSRSVGSDLGLRKDVAPYSRKVKRKTINGAKRMRNLSKYLTIGFVVCQTQRYLELFIVTMFFWRKFLSPFVLHNPTNIRNFRGRSHRSDVPDYSCGLGS